MSCGVHHTFPKERFTLGLMYGFSPATDLARAYHGISLRSSFSKYQLKMGDFRFRPYVLLTANLEIGGTAFLSLPDQFPDEYYAPQALHAIGGIGLRTTRKLGNGELSFTMETVTLDTYMWYTIIQKQINFHEAWSMALGLEYRFNR